MIEVGSDVWRVEAPHVLAALLRRSADLGACEDAVQEALLAAATQWPVDGIPDNPRGWLVRVASRKLLDQQRSDAARARREQQVALQSCVDPHAPGADDRGGGDQDDMVALLVLCCHPSLTAVSQVALTLRAVAGLTTAQVAAGLLVPETTVAQRISRAKATLRRVGARFQQVPRAEVPARLHAVRHVLYLLFNEGYTSSAGEAAIDSDLTREALRLAERLHRANPDDGETAGLLALMLLTDARTPARLTTGDLIPLAEQDRTRWDADKIRRGTMLLEHTLVAGPVGPFQLQAAIAGVHAGARTWAQTDWLEICILYRMLDRQAPSPTVSLNLGVAIGMAHGPRAGLASLDGLLQDSGQQRNHRLHAARAHLLEAAGDRSGAATAYRAAARLTRSIPEQRYLNRRLAALIEDAQG